MSQYIPLLGTDTVTNALNFSTAEYHVIGGCEIFTTKAAKDDKKLLKNIDNHLEAQYASLVRLSASLSPPYRTASEDGQTNKGNNRGKRGHSVGVQEIDLSRSSPFGSLSKISSRRVFAHLVATMNESHPDYDFSNFLKPADFKKERSMRSIIHNVDITLHNLRPRLPGTISSWHLGPASAMFSNSAKVLNSSGAEVWSPRMWTLIDKEMSLLKCELYSYAPNTDPLDDEASAIWSMHYFFYNRAQKRVCYLYLRGLSVLSHSPVYAPVARVSRRPKSFGRKASGVSVSEGAEKRASYWLGNHVGIDTQSYGDDDDDEMMMIDGPNDDEVDDIYMDLDDQRRDWIDGLYGYDVDGYDELDDAYLDEGWTRGISF